MCVKKSKNIRARYTSYYLILYLYSQILLSMCTNKREIWIPNMNKTMYVNCGHCPACEQEKALKRTNRIQYQDRERNLVSYFLTLTYDNKYVPYIRQTDFDRFVNGESEYLPVYRDFDRLWRQVKNSDGVRLHELRDVPQVKPLKLLTRDDFIYYGYNFDFSLYKNYKLPLVRHWLDSRHHIQIPNKTAVVWNDDFSKFIKKFKQRLKDLGYDASPENFKYFYCSEYGPDGHRCHAHVVFWLPWNWPQNTWLDAMAASWPYADRDRTLRKENFDRCKNAASYVSSYVNCDNDAEIFFKYAKPFKVHHKMSYDFGFGLDQFSASSLQKKFLARDLRYVVGRTRKGKFTEELVIIPKYVLNRFFAKFKGYSKFTSSEICDIILHPEKLYCYEYAKRAGLIWSYDKFSRSADKLPEGLRICYHGLRLVARDEIKQIINSINKRFERFNRDTGASREEFALIYSEIWSIWASNMMIDNHAKLQDNRHYVYFFDNVKLHYEGVLYNDLIDYALSLIDFDNLARLPSNPNDFPDNVMSTENMTYWFYQYNKNKKLRDIIYQSKIS